MAKLREGIHTFITENNVGLEDGDVSIETNVRQFDGPLLEVVLSQGVENIEAIWLDRDAAVELAKVILREAGETYTVAPDNKGTLQ